VNPDGTWNTTSPAYAPIFDAAAVTDVAVQEEIRLALSKDAAGKSRFNNNKLDLGAVQEVRP
jgi:hypothetical protein